MGGRDLTPINKVFYQQAAAEAALGRVDRALWVKIRADNPDADETSLHARYIRARAEELAAEGLKTSVATAVKKRTSLVNDAILAALVLGGLLAATIYFDTRDRVQRDSRALSDATQALNKATDHNDQYAYGEALRSVEHACQDISAMTKDMFGRLSDPRSESDKQVASGRCVHAVDIEDTRAFHQIDNADLERQAQALEAEHPESFAGQPLRMKERELPMPMIQ